MFLKNIAIHTSVIERLKADIVFYDKFIDKVSVSDAHAGIFSTALFYKNQIFNAFLRNCVPVLIKSNIFLRRKPL